jgi:serine protease Do
MIMDAAGHILTNNHVVAGATEIDVLLEDGNHYKATLVGRDPKTDLAVIRVSAKSALPYVSFGDSDKVEVGEWVVAIGHPRGFDQTVTQGIISAKHRRGITDPSGYQDFLQTDAAVNPGNSGGPLLNLAGEVVGVNAAIVSESGGFEGISFAIPSNMAQHVARALIMGGKVERGWLGVTVDVLTPELAASLGLPSPRGALVGDVVKGGPADRGGLRRGDVILTLGGKDMSDGGAVRNELAGATLGQELKLVVWRGGVKQDVTVKVGKPEEANAALAAASRERLGIGVRRVRPIEARRYGLDSGQGVAIQAIDPRSAFAEVGIELGDVLLEIDGQAIEGVDGFADLTGGLKSGRPATWLVLDHRAGQTAYVRITVR